MLQRRADKKGKDQVDSKELKQDGPSSHLDGPKAEVTMSLGVTLNLGNYESMKVHVGLTVPTSPRNIDKAYDLVAKRVSSELKKRVFELTGREI